MDLIYVTGRSRKKGGTVVIMGNQKQVEQERINAYKANLMQKAMVMFEELDEKHKESKIQLFQREEMQKHRNRVELEKAKRSRHTGDDFEILCRRCSKFACYVTDVRSRGHDYLVIDAGFKDRITTKPHKSPKKYDGIEKKSKMFCKGCPQDWGIIAEKDGADLRILKIISFKFRNLRTQDITTYTKWINMPYNVPEITDNDLTKLYGGQAEETN